MTAALILTGIALILAAGWLLCWFTVCQDLRAELRQVAERAAREHEALEHLRARRRPVTP